MILKGRYYFLDGRPILNEYRKTGREDMNCIELAQHRV
jgi:hypothetical protein